MRSMIRLVALLSLAVAASGCSLVASFQDRIGSAVGRYCEESQTSRDALREYLNARTEPNGIYIVCEGDPEVENPTG